VINYIEFITEYGLSVKNFIIIISLFIPKITVLTIPISSFGGVIFAYDRLIKNNEIVILQNIGIKKFQLIGPVLCLNIIIAFLLCLNVMFFIPSTNKQSNDMKDTMKNDIINLMFKNDNFDSVKNITFYANANQKEKLDNLVLYIKSTKDGEKDKIIYSKTAEVNNTYIKLFDGNIQEFRPKNKGENNIIFFKEYSLNFGDYYNIDDKKNTKSTNIDTLNIFELFKFTKNKKINIEIIKRILNSIIGLFLSILACCLVLNKKFSRMDDDWENVKIYSLCTVLFAIFSYLIKSDIHYNLLLLYIFTIFMLDLILIWKKNAL
jgi:lipopolysaccharide export LptBFGC system permease protein LptF